MPLLTKAQTVVVDAKLKRMRSRTWQAESRQVTSSHSEKTRCLPTSRMGDGRRFTGLLASTKSIIWQRVTGPVLAITLILYWKSLALLYRFFGAYSNQFMIWSLTLNRIEKVSSTIVFEKLISRRTAVHHSINTMLDQYQVNIQKFILMEVMSTKPFKALQSQINPFGV